MPVERPADHASDNERELGVPCLVVNVPSVTASTAGSILAWVIQKLEVLRLAATFRASPIASPHPFQTASRSDQTGGFKKLGDVYHP